MSELKPDSRLSSPKLLSVVLPLSFIGSLAILFVLLFRTQTLSDLSGQLESSAAKKGQITAEIEQLKERLNVLKADTSTTQIQLTALTEQREAAEDLIGQTAAAEKTLERLRAEADSSVEDAKRQQASSSASLAQIRTATFTAEADSKQLQERLNALKADASTTQTRLTALTEQRKEAVELIAQAATAGKTLERLRADAASSVEDAKRQQASLTASLDQIRAAIVTAEADSKTRKTELEDSIQQLRKDQESSRKVIAEQRKLLDQNNLGLAQSEQDISTANDKLGALKVQLVQADAQIKAKNANLKDIENRIAIMQAKALARVGTEKTPDELAADIAELKREISDLRQKLAEPATKPE